MAFWNDAPMTHSLLEIILQEQDVNLRDIIFEDDLLNECRAGTGNEALVKFMKDNVMELVELVTGVENNAQETLELFDELPGNVLLDDDDDANNNNEDAAIHNESNDEASRNNTTNLINGIKNRSAQNERSPLHMSFIASEIMSAGEPDITDAIVRNTDALNKLMTCLIQNGHKANTQARHRKEFESVHTILISKIITALHNHRGQQLLDHIESNELVFKQFLDTLIDSIEYSGCVEIIGTFIDNTEPIDIRYKYCELLNKNNLIPRLIDIISADNDEEKQRNAGQLLCDINRFGNLVVKNNQSLPLDVLLKALESNVPKILENMFSFCDPERLASTLSLTTFMTGMRVLQSLVEQSDKTQLPEKLAYEIIPYLPRFRDLIISPPAQGMVKIYRQYVVPLGVTRLETIHFIAALVVTNHPGIIDSLEQLEIITHVIDLFFYYTWNNLLHTQVEQIIYSLVNNYRRDADCHFVANAPKTVAKAAAAAAKAAETTAAVDKAATEAASSTASNIHISNNNNNNDESSESTTTNIGNNITQSPTNSQSNNASTMEHQDSVTSTDLPPPPPSPPPPEMPSRKLLLQLLRQSRLIERLVRDRPDSSTRRDPCLANYGHIVLIANYLSINSDLDPIKEYLQEVSENNAELYAHWKNFIDDSVVQYHATSTKLSRHLQANDTTIVNQRGPSENIYKLRNDIDIELAFIEYQNQDVAPVMNPSVTTRPTNNSTAFQYFPEIESFGSPKARNYEFC